MNDTKNKILIFFEKSSQHQLFRYAVVGSLNNLRGYLTYLLLTWLWLDPKVAVSLMYPVGAAIAYLGHARYTFSYNGVISNGVIRYVIAHLIGYSINIVILYIMSDRLGYPHQLVQAFAIVVVAFILFLMFRYFVFQTPPEPFHGIK
ncbi:GtrA family protein [uncultured Porticoccus sp.]|uniref:GtrA family protein n=1 Tax=uncultured Porticoccus sp. TaxID=1256050 RepID=UPI0030D82D74|tara:strand:+ start:146 stop:586 length:441 start_codon:yes stop_codon:yes gene_type:complete